MGILKSDRNYTVWAVVIIISDHERYTPPLTTSASHISTMNSTALLLAHSHTD